MNWLLWIFFREHYVGQNIYRTRDLGFNKIGGLKLEVIKIFKESLLVKVTVTGDLIYVVK